MLESQSPKRLPLSGGEVHCAADRSSAAYRRFLELDPESPDAEKIKGRSSPDVAAILLDVVLGYGAHDDPAGMFAPECQAIAERGGPVVVAYVLGTEADPQVYSRQREVLEQAGCLVPETNARGAYAAAALALRRPEVAAT